MLKRQEESWLPLLSWFCSWHGLPATEVAATSSITPPTVSPRAREAVRKYLLSHSLPCLHAFAFGTDSVKSLVLMCAVAEGRLTVDQAVDMARLEVKFQVLTNQDSLI